LNRNTRFDSVFDSDVNGRFTGPYHMFSFGTRLGMPANLKKIWQKAGLNNNWQQ